MFHSKATQLFDTFRALSPISQRTTKLLLSAAFILTAVIIVAITEKEGIEWKYAHWFFSYEYGFVKRGLIGELIRWIPIPPSLDFFNIVSTLSLITIAALFLSIIINMPSRDFLAFSALFLLTPILFRNYVLDFGRYDQIAIIYVLIQISLIERKRLSGWFLFLSPLLLLTHEATAFWAFPSILTIGFFENRAALFKVIPLLGLTAAAVLVWGDLEMDLQTYYKHLQEWAKPVEMHWAVVFSLVSNFDAPLFRYVSHFWEVFNTPKGYMALYYAVVFILPLFLIKNRLLLLFSIGAVLSSCLLFVFAVDYWRWVSLMGTSVLFSLLYAYKKCWLLNPPLLSLYFILIGLFGLLFEPIGIFPYVLAIVDLTPKHNEFFGSAGN